MILTLPELITPEELALVKQLVAGAGFTEGKSTAGELLQKAKNNQQIPWDHPVMKKIAGLVMQALGRNDAFMGAAQPRRLAAMLVSRYQPGMAYGMHVDAPIMAEPNHVRSDVSFTLFLNEPDSYEGGELAFESGSGETAFKLPARSAICFRPMSSSSRLRNQSINGASLAPSRSLRMGRSMNCAWPPSRWGGTTRRRARRKR